jgi:Mg2+ and Co2+ transporter CorA
LWEGALAAIMVDQDGARACTGVEDVEKAVASSRLFWLDIVGESEADSVALLKAAGLDDAEIAGAVRFRQTGRMRFSRGQLRVVTWIADSEGALIEFHLVGLAKGIVTLWNADPAALDRIRQQFSYSVAGVGDDMQYAAGLLLQLLMGTLDSSLEALDVHIDRLRLSLGQQSSSMDVTRGFQRMQTFASGFSRYAGAVRSATVGVESLPGVTIRAAAEFNDYVDLVEDFEERLYERRRWLSDITHDFATAVAQRQSEQISRLTIVSLIFLPVTALTGFFGMNFQWLVQAIASKDSFFILGLLLPALGMILTVVWLARRGLMRLDLWR